MADFVIDNLHGGQNSYDQPTSLPNDQVVEATNVEFVSAQLAARRLGCDAISLTGSGLDAHEKVVWAHRHTPSQIEGAAELWALGTTGEATSTLARKTDTWSNPTLVDPILLANGAQYWVEALSAHQKLFIAYKSAVDRLHVWDGTSIRRVGLASSPNAPPAVDSGTGTYAGMRFFRVRFVEQNASGAVVRRSEASPVTTFTPSGTGGGAEIGRPAPPTEGETHWELEASVDNANFYRTATIPIGTTSVLDTTPYAQGYAQTFPLSAVSGSYTPPHSARYLALDEDRVIVAGSFENEALASRVAWTVVYGDPTGVGNDERIPIDSVNFVDLDAGEGGGLTGLSGPVNGSVWAFKRNAIYKGIRTGIRSRAYDFIAMSKQRGAIPGSLIEGVDQYGGPALYFLDPEEGPCRITRTHSIHRCGRDIHNRWEDMMTGTSRVNLDAPVICEALYYPRKQQVHWWIATEGSATPNMHIVLHTAHIQDSDTGARRGWAVWTGASATGVLASCLVSSNIDAGTTRNNDLRPLIGGTLAGRLALMDTGDTDLGTSYTAYVRTRPYIHHGMLHRFAVQNGTVVARPAPGAQVRISLDRNFGMEITRTVTVDLSPVGTERQVIRPLDNLAGAELHAVQVVIEDAPGNVGRWALNLFALKEVKGQTS